MPVVNDGLLNVCDILRGLQGPSYFGIAKTKVTIVQRTWSGQLVGSENGSIDVVLADLPQIYLVKPVTTSQIMGSGGQYEVGDIRVGAITPAFNFAGSNPNTPTVGGWSEAQLHPVSTVEWIETVYKLTGAHKGEYQFVALESWEAISYWLVLRRRVTQPVEP